MSAATDLLKARPEPSDPDVEPLVLENGARMTREEFHRLYEQTPEDFRAELIGGIVYVSSPVRNTHGEDLFDLITLFGVYKLATPGIAGAENCTVLLGEECEPQPDIFLRILPEFGGQSTTTSNDYVKGAPELVIEVALSSASIDLHRKRRDYAESGVREYVVVVPLASHVAWFNLTTNKELAIPGDGIIRSLSFPGLWLNTPAILKKEWNAAMATLQAGLASPEHHTFVEQLAQRRAASQ